MRVSRLALFLPSILAGGLEADDFLRGDANRDGSLDIADPQFTISYLFLGGARPRCLAALDSNDDERVELSDVIRALGFLFLGLPPSRRPGRSRPRSHSGPRLRPTPSLGPLLRGALAGGASSYRDRPLEGGRHSYEVRGVRGAQTGEAAGSTVSGLPAGSCRYDRRRTSRLDLCPLRSEDLVKEVRSIP
jgi:hypothetical protein